MITACPLWFYNLKEKGGNILPVRYFTELLAEALHDRDEGLAVFLRREFPNVLAETSPWRDRCFHLWEKTWKFIQDKRDDCIFYFSY